MAFLHQKKKKKTQNFWPTNLAYAFTFILQWFSLSLSPFWSQNQKPHHQFLSLYSTRIFSLSLIGSFVLSLSLSLSRLSSKMFCFVFFNSTRLIRFGGGKSKLWLWILWLWVGGGCGCGDGSVGFNLGLGVGLPVAMAVVVVVLMIMPLWVWIWWWWWRWVLSSCGKGLWWWWMWILDLVLVLQLVCYGEF